MELWFQQLQSFISGSRLTKRRIGGEPEELVGVEVGNGETLGDSPPRVVVPDPDPPKMWIRDVNATCRVVRDALLRSTSLDLVPSHRRPMHRFNGGWGLCHEAANDPMGLFHSGGIFTKPCEDQHRHTGAES